MVARFDLSQGDAAGGHEFLPEGPAAADPVTAVPQRGDQGLLAAAGEISPAQCGIHPVQIEQMQPEAAAEVRPGAPVAELPARLLPARAGEPVLQLRRTAAAGPVHPQRRRGSRRSCRARAAKAVSRRVAGPLRPQWVISTAPRCRWGASRAAAGAPSSGRQDELQLHRIHAHAGQGRQGVIGEGEGEQRGHRRHQAMAQGPGDPMAAGMASGGQHESLGQHLGPRPQGQPETPSRQGFRRLAAPGPCAAPPRRRSPPGAGCPPPRRSGWSGETGGRRPPPPAPGHGPRTRPPCRRGQSGRRARAGPCPRGGSAPPATADPSRHG